MLSTDRKAFEEGSAVRERFREYAGTFGELHVIIFSLAKLGLRSETVKGNLHLHPTNSKSKLLYVRDAARIGKNLPTPTIITAQDPFEVGFAGYVLRSALRTPLQLQVHTDFRTPAFARTSALNVVRGMLARFLLPRADGVRVVSSRIAASLKQYKLKTPPVILPIVVDVAALQKAPRSEALRERFARFSHRLLVVSRLEREKNVAGALRAFVEVRKTFPDAGLIVVGEGSERKSLEECARRMGAEGSVVFEGWQQPAAYYKEADVLVAPLLYDGFGMSVVEALASGLPVVATDVGIAREAGATVVAHERDMPAAIVNVLKKKEPPILTISIPTKAEYLARYRDSLLACS